MAPVVVVVAFHLLTGDVFTKCKDFCNLRSQWVHPYRAHSAHHTRPVIHFLTIALYWKKTKTTYSFK